MGLILVKRGDHDVGCVMRQRVLFVRQHPICPQHVQSFSHTTSDELARIEKHIGRKYLVQPMPFALIDHMTVKRQQLMDHQRVTDLVKGRRFMGRTANHADRLQSRRCPA